MYPPPHPPSKIAGAIKAVGGFLLYVALRLSIGVGFTLGFLIVGDAVGLYPPGTMENAFHNIREGFDRGMDWLGGVGGVVPKALVVPMFRNNRMGFGTT